MKSIKDVMLEARDFLAKGEIKEALKRLMKHINLNPASSATNTTGHDDLRILSARYAGLEKRRTRGTISDEDYILERNRLIELLLEWISSHLDLKLDQPVVAKDNSSTQKSSKEIKPIPASPPTKYIDRALLQEFEKLPREHLSQFYLLSSILPKDVKYLNESTRKALRIPTSYRDWYFIEIFADLSGQAVKFERIPNQDYHINLLFSDEMYATIKEFLFEDFQFDTSVFRYSPIEDKRTINSFKLDLIVRFLGHIKKHRTSSGREGGSFFEVTGVVR